MTDLITRNTHRNEGERLRLLCPPIADCHNVGDMYFYFAAYDEFITAEAWQEAAQVLHVWHGGDDPSAISKLLLWGEWNRCLMLLERLLPHFDALEPRTQNGLLLALTRTHIRLTNYDAAHIHGERLLAIARATHDSRMEGKILITLSFVAAYTHPQRALDLLEQALIAIRLSRDVVDEASCLNNIGNIYSRNFNDQRRATTYYEQAWRLAKRSNNRASEAIYVGNLGIAFASMGEYRTALPFLQEGLNLSRQSAYRYTIAAQLVNIGEIQRLVGDLSAAIETLEEGVTITTEIGDHLVESYALAQLALAYFEVGRIDEAQQTAQKAHDLGLEAEHPPSTNLAVIVFGLVAEKRDDTAQALAHFANAAHSSLASKNPDVEGETLYYLARLAAEQGDTTRALVALAQALSLLIYPAKQVTKDANALAVRLRGEWRGGTDQYDRFNRIIQRLRTTDRPPKRTA